MVMATGVEKVRCVLKVRMEDEGVSGAVRHRSSLSLSRHHHFAGLTAGNPERESWSSRRRM